MSGSGKRSEIPKGQETPENGDKIKSFNLPRARYLDMKNSPANCLEEYMSALAKKSNGGEGDTPEAPKVVALESGARSVEPTDNEGNLKSRREVLEEIFGPESEEEAETADKINPFSDLPPPIYHKGTVEEQALVEASEFLAKNTLEDELKALSILEECGVLAYQRWEDMHTETDPERKHLLSEVSNKRINPLAKDALKHVKLEKGALFMELGCGMGNDILWLAGQTEAHFIGIDSSQKVIGDVRYLASEADLNDRMDFGCNNFLEVLDAAREMKMDFDGIFSHSSLHYNPPLVLRDIIFPKIATALSSDPESPGVLCLAMKIAKSASAQGGNQHRLLPDNPYNPSIDLRDRMFRIYPQTKEDLIVLLEPSFDIIDIKLVPVISYDREGEVEYFCHIIAKPKKKPEQKGDDKKGAAQAEGSECKVDIAA